MSRASRFRFASRMLDLSVLAAALSFAAWIGDGTFPDEFAHILVYLALWLPISRRVGTYDLSPAQGLGQSTRSALEAWAVNGAVAGLIDLQLLQGEMVWINLLAGAIALGVARLLMRRVPALSPEIRPRTMIVGAGNPGSSSVFTRFESDFLLTGKVDLPGESGSHHTLPTLCEFEDLPRHVDAIDLVLLCPSDAAKLGDVHRVFDLCDSTRLNIHYFPPFLQLHNLHMTLPRLVRQEGIGFHGGPDPSFATVIKRCIDLVGAGIGLLLLLPVLLVIAVMVKLSSPGPVFFRQTRVGEKGERFTCLKFRTMRVGAFALQEKLRAASVQDGPAFKIPNDPRITPVGRILRKFSLDELPQLINVLIGDMSLVGPRPPIPSEVEHYTWWQRRRVSVKPGLTCVWQVWGRNRVSFKRWVEMDLYYIDNWSVWLDLKLIAHTFVAVVRGTGM